DGRAHARRSPRDRERGRTNHRQGSAILRRRAEDDRSLMGCPCVSHESWLGQELRERIMRVGILGSGLMGGKLGTIFTRAGHEVVFSYVRSEQKLKVLARDAKGKARAGTPREAAQEADAVLLAVHWSRIEDVLNQTGDLSGKVIVTCSLPMNDDNTELIVPHTSSGAEEVAKMIPKARVVAAFNTVPSEVLFGVYEAKRKT